MLRIFAIRVTNLRAMREFYEDEIGGLSAKLGVTPSYISQLIGPNPTLVISEKSARAFEKKLRLPVSWLDRV